MKMQANSLNGSQTAYHVTDIDFNAMQWNTNRHTAVGSPCHIPCYSHLHATTKLITFILLIYSSRAGWRANQLCDIHINVNAFLRLDSIYV